MHALRPLPRPFLCQFMSTTPYSFRACLVELQLCQISFRAAAPPQSSSTTEPDSSKTFGRALASLFFSFASLPSRAHTSASASSFILFLPSTPARPALGPSIAVHAGAERRCPRGGGLARVGLGRSAAVHRSRPRQHARGACAAVRAWPSAVVAGWAEVAAGQAQRGGRRGQRGGQPRGRGSQPRRRYMMKQKIE